MIIVSVTDMPKLKATRAMPESALFLGKRDARREYPGKNSMNGTPNIALKALLGKAVMIITSSTVTMFIMKSSLIDLLCTISYSLLFSKSIDDSVYQSVAISNMR